MPKGPKGEMRAVDVIGVCYDFILSAARPVRLLTRG
jgi:hypothetical protein